MDENVEFQREYLCYWEDQSWKKPGACGYYVNARTKEKLPVKILEIDDKHGIKIVWCEIMTVTGKWRKVWLGMDDIYKE